MKRSIFVSLQDARVFDSRTDFLGQFFKGRKMRVLDVGNLGEGEELIPVKSLVESAGGEHFGLDVNENLAKAAKIKNQLIGDLHDLKEVVKDETFDCVYAGQIIEHTWKPGQMISECNRILKKSGYLVLDTPNAFDVINILRLLIFKKDTLGFDVAVLTYNEAKDNFRNYREEQKKILSQPQHKIFFGPAMLRQLLHMHGFSVEYFAYIRKPRNVFHRLFLFLFPQLSQQIGVVARKSTLENIFDVDSSGDNPLTS